MASKKVALCLFLYCSAKIKNKNNKQNFKPKNLNKQKNNYKIGL